MEIKICKKCLVEKPIDSFVLRSHGKHRHTCRNCVSLMAANRKALKYQKHVVFEPIDGELWLPVVGHEGSYEVSSIGRVKSTVTKYAPSKIMKLGNNKGYYKVFMAGKSYAVHRLVAKAFIPNPENKPQVNHINCVKNDNRIENLEWVTGHENMIHAIKTNDYYKGAHVSAKLSENDVREIIQHLIQGRLRYHQLAKIYGVTKEAITAIAVNKSWKHIPRLSYKQKPKGTNSRQKRFIESIPA